MHSGEPERWWAENGTWFSAATFNADCAFNPPVPCSEDIDGDGVIATSDVILILTEFGCSANCALTSTGTELGVSDVLSVLSRFGEIC